MTVLYCKKKNVDKGWHYFAKHLISFGLFLQVSRDEEEVKILNEERKVHYEKVSMF